MLCVDDSGGAEYLTIQDAVTDAVSGDLVYIYDGVYHEENLACLEMNGVKRYITGLNEFDPKVKMLSKDKKKTKIKEMYGYSPDEGDSFALTFAEPVVSATNLHYTQTQANTDYNILG